MVSLLNYKAVNEDLQQHQHQHSQQQQHQQHDHHHHYHHQHRTLVSSALMSRNDVHDSSSEQSTQQAVELDSRPKLAQDAHTSNRRASTSEVVAQAPLNQATPVEQQAASVNSARSSAASTPEFCSQNFTPDAKEPHRLSCSMSFPPNAFVGLHQQQQYQLAKNNSSSAPFDKGNEGAAFDRHNNQQQWPDSSFTVTWRNLRFCIEPKWHEKLAYGSSRLALLAQRVTKQQPCASVQHQIVGANALQLGAACNQPALTRVVLDHLDGSFKSGELTAILGPSGAGKTTLLDCLTGHRKSGLSGSIRFSSSAGSSSGSGTGQNSHNCSCGCCCCLAAKSNLKPQHKQYPHHAATEITTTTATNGDNLKVSIIPQNDHLIGHLTVYETLNYASKMKNCFDKQFDHKLNIKRVAQQLGLMSCLGTRINKLSGGQYKRVSIAQELLSSPDILILDEPTSGLDAMTCYQTVQVLRKLTDERSSMSADGVKQRLKPIAVILTIHQPNSDVFQQFNHVYVVAQGGKCIYEGPPASIESVINRIGLHLPNSYYNPATMIVEIAAGKFGHDSIVKLNGIQKKQHAQQFACPLGDEQNSTGDSAVDCPSSSCSLALSSSSHDSDYDDAKVVVASDENNNNNNNRLEKNTGLNLTKISRVGLEQSSNDGKRECNENTTISGAVSDELLASSGDAHRPSDCRYGQAQTDRKHDHKLPIAGGLVNKGFVMDAELGPGESAPTTRRHTETSHSNDNNNNNNNGSSSMLVGSCCYGSEAKSALLIGLGGGNGARAPNAARAQPLTLSSAGQRDCCAIVGSSAAPIMIHDKIAGRQSGCCSQLSKPCADDIDCDCGRRGVEGDDKGANFDNRSRKKRRRARRRAASLLSVVPGADSDGPSFSSSASRAKDTTVQIGIVGSGSGNGGGGGGGGGGAGGGGRNEKRLKLNSLNADQKFPFWRHTYLHFHRSWLSIVRDPMLCSMQLALHIIVPVMVSLVYGTRVGKPNACPRAGPVDIMAFALEPNDTALQLQEDLRTTLENIGYIFFKLYGIIFAAMTVTVLTFPLDMHVLVKEFRNGWYGLSSYFLGRTLADIPFQLTLPLLAMALSYYATGQPYSHMQWRFFSITAILILSSLIAQSQGLLFGAILMDRMKAAVFVAPAATTPIILFAGFLVRTQSIPHYLRPLSNLSYLRYAIEACLISRYGFNQCECDPAIFNQSVPELPPIARSMLDYWLSSFKPLTLGTDSDSVAAQATNASTSALETTTVASEQNNQPDLFTKLIDSLARANSFGRNITSCEQVVPYPMMDYDLKDSQLVHCFAILLAMLIFTRLLTFLIVCFKVKRKV